MKRFASILRERTPALLERISEAAEARVFNEDASGPARQLWREIWAGSLERIAEYLEGGQLPEKESLRESVMLMGERGIGISETLGMKSIICGAVCGEMVEAGNASPLESVEVCKAVDRTTSVGVDAFLEYTEELFSSGHKGLLDSIGKMGVVVFRAKLDSTLVQVNETGVALLGAESADQVIGRKFAEFYADAAEREALRSELHSKGQVVGVRFRGRRLDGVEFWAETNVQVKFDADGRPGHLEGFAREVTEQVEGDRALRESEEKYRTLFQTAAEGILVADVETREFRYANPAVCRMLGYTESELIGLGVTDIHPPEALSHVISEFEAQARGEKALVTDIPCLHKDGEVIYVDINTVKALVDGRQCNVGFFTDTTELTQVQRQLEMQRQRLEHVVSSLGAGISLLNPDRTIEWLNEPMASWFGPLEQVRGRRCYEVYHGRQLPCEDCPASRSMETGKTCAADTTVVVKGEERVFRMTSTPMTDESGKIVQILELAQDVTEERAHELEAGRNAELLSGILGSAVEYGVVATDGDGVINYFSESAELLFGKRSHEVVGSLHVKALWLPEKRRRLVEDLEQIARTGRYEEETELLRTQGLTFNARVSGSARRDEAGEVTGFTFVIRDVTEERAAQKLVTMLAHALESSREGVTLTDMSGVITYVNPMMTAMTGRGAEEMLGRDFSIFYPEDFGGDEVRAIARATLAGGWSGEVENINRDGVRFPVHLTTSLVRDERGRAVAMVGLARDVTREKSLQKRLFEQEQRHLAELERQVRERTAELERAYRDLQKLDAMKDRFLTNISHELRTPLVSGVGYIELILQEGLGPINGEIRNGLRVAHRNLLRLVNLIDDLLAFTRLESGGDAMVISRFSLEQMVTDCLLDLKVRANKAELHVEMEVEKGLPPIEADEENVHRVFTNLLSNAEKFTGEEACIRVRASKLSEERVEVRLEDDGMGIPEDEIAHIFERFYRSGRTQSTRYSGTGIGLSLVKEILSSHECDIRAESPEGKGTTIVFTLPLARKGAQAPPASSTDGGSGERRPATILVIDDDPEVHDLLGAVFAAPGDRLLVASGGQEGLGLAAREELDLVFLDISMDDMDGIAVLRQLRAGEKTRHLPIFMLTARADDRSVVESRKAGASGFITKPFSLSEVRGVVEDILAGSYPDGTD